MKEVKQGCNLKDCFLCKYSLPEWLRAINTYKKNFKVKKGEVIIREGDDVKGVYFVHSGTVKVHKKWGEDKELIVRFATNGAILGHRGLGSNSVYPISGTALEDSVVCFIDLDFFEATLKTNNAFTYKLMMFFADELQESERKMRNLAHMSVKGRVAQALITLKNQFGTNKDNYIGFELSRQDLASFAGATYETVFRVINELLKENLIDVSGKKIKINDPEKLLQLTAQDL